MFSGKTAAAMQLLASEPGRGGVLHLDDTIPGSGKVYDILKSQHPAAAPLHYEALLYLTVLLQILCILLSLMHWMVQL